MTVPATLDDLSTTASLNPPSGSDNVFPELDNQIRQIYAFEATLYAGGKRLGSMGLGITPSTWSGAAKALEVAFNGHGLAAFGQSDCYVVSNAYYNSGWKYAYTAAAAKHSMVAGVHSFDVAASGSANASITWTTAVTINNAGNLGIGIAPSAWGTGTAAVEAKYAGNAVSSLAASNAVFSSNAYFDGTNWKYGTTNAASHYQQTAGAHVWKQAASGTAGNTITWTTPLQIDANGNVLINGASQHWSDKVTVGPSANGSVAALNTPKAWCRFNGTSAGPITPLAAYNVASITKNGTGDYTLNFTNAMADANYSAVITSRFESGVSGNIAGVMTYATGSLRIQNANASGLTLADSTLISVVIYGN